MSRKEKIVYSILLVSFILLSLLIGMNHEQWADEAHAWMIARDTSFYSLFFQYLHTDGHPALWHLILKFFQFIGFEYKHIYIISTIFSSIGVGIFLFKSNLKWYIKVLLPFSYFVFYQYTIVARGYCLILLLLSLIATIWDDRIKKCYLFTFFLILLMSAEAYTFMLAGVITIIAGFLQLFWLVPVALIIATPVSTAVTTPVLFTVATPSSEDAQVKF